MKKILYSPGYGAGWSTWNSGPSAKFMMTYKPIIEYLEKGGKFSREDCRGEGTNNGPTHPLLKRLQKECKENFGVDYVCVLGADDLRVGQVSGPFRIKEYDGFESIEHRDDVDWIE